jgi:Rrf2 family iron-sulfur cluster assembly transcriptional regulator|tara:strand:- start:80 stop:529 length:450 start_codon:yes stop_codon:yes gene_type:complete
MRLTTKGKYAVTALLDLSLHQSGKEFISLSKIAARQDMPISYLEQLFRNLRKAGIVEAARGPTGGYRLSRHSSEINVSEVVASVEGAMDATQCGGASDCHAGTRCLAHDLWSELNSQVDNFLISKSLEDVIANERSSQDRKLKDLIVTG